MTAETYHKMLLVRFQRRLEQAKADLIKAKAEGHHGQVRILKDEVYDLDRGLQYVEAWTPWLIEQFEKHDTANV
jgi:hypothetical protein